MVSVAEPGAGLLTRCILMDSGDEAGFALKREGIVRVLRALHCTLHPAAKNSCSRASNHTHKSFHFCFDILVTLLSFNQC